MRREAPKRQGTGQREWRVQGRCRKHCGIAEGVEKGAARGKAKEKRGLQETAVGRCSGWLPEASRCVVLRLALALDALVALLLPGGRLRLPGGPRKHQDPCKHEDPMPFGIF